jgi:hypothetical protein
MKSIAFILGLAAAVAASAQEQTKADTKPRPALNLRLDDATTAAPRITFDQAPSAQTKDEREKGLPELGGKTREEYNRPINPSSSGSPIPQPMEPSRNYDLRR